MEFSGLAASAEIDIDGVLAYNEADGKGEDFHVALRGGDYRQYGCRKQQC
jgi:hypothetical protein